MTHVLTTIPPVAGWYIPVCFMVLALAVLFAVVCARHAEESVFAGLTFVGFVSCLVIAATLALGWLVESAEAKNALNPDTSVIAPKLGLRIMPGDNEASSAATWLDKDGTRYVKCYVDSRKANATHVDSTLHCLRDGKSVTVSKVG